MIPNLISHYYVNIAFKAVEINELLNNYQKNSLIYTYADRKC